MNKLLTLALIVFFALDSQSGNSQSIVLINGEAMQVTLTGSQINTIIQHRIDDYMGAFDQGPDDGFQKAVPRTHNSQKAIYHAPAADFQASADVLWDLSILSSEGAELKAKED